MSPRASPLSLLVSLLTVGVTRAGTEVDPRYDDKELLNGKFPDNFLWGTWSSAYQVEGGFAAAGKAGATRWR